MTCYHHGILLPSLAISLHDFFVVCCTYTRAYTARRKCFKTNGSIPANELEATKSCLLDRFMYKVSRNMWLTLFHKRIRAQDFPRLSFIFRVIKNLILSYMYVHRTNIYHEKNKQTQTANIKINVIRKTIL